MKTKLFILIGVLLSTSAFAGDCTEDEAIYLTNAQASATSSEDPLGAMYCLVAQNVPYYVMGYETPFQKRESLEKARALSSPHRQLVLDRTQYLLDQPSFPSDFKSSVLKLRLLVGDSSAWDEVLNQMKTLSPVEDDTSESYVVMVLGLGKITVATDWIVEVDQQAKAKYKTKPDFSLPKRKTCLNALAYLDTEKSWELVKKYSEDSGENPKIREHAARLIRTLGKAVPSQS